MLFFFILSQLSAQEFNYWLNGVGSRSNMLAGAVTAGVRDNSAIYYNPAGLAFIENSSLSVTSDGYYLSWLGGKNTAGTDLHLESSTLDGMPQIVSFIQKVPKLPISVTLALLNRHYSNIRINFRNNMVYDVLPENPGDELYVGSYSYYNKIREQWGGFGYGKELFDGFGIGVSTFFTFRTQNYYLSESADVYEISGDTTNLHLLSNTNFTDELDYAVAGLLFVVGVTYEIDGVKLGMTITTPRINMGFVSKSDLKRNLMRNIPELDPDISKISVWQIKVPSRYRSPLIIDLGADFNLNEKYVLYTKVSYFSPVKKYRILKEDAVPDEDLSVILPEDFYELDNMYMASKSVVNAAISVQRHVSENFEVILGFRTDFNYNDETDLDIHDDFVPGKLAMNLYHLSGGVIWKTEKYNLSVGGSYTYGMQKDALQYINLSDPSVDNDLFGVQQNTASPTYNQVGVYLGFTYFFPRI